LALPVVATAVPGCVDAVQDRVTGTLVPPRDAAALTEAIRHYLLDPELRRRHGRAGRETGAAGVSAGGHLGRAVRGVHAPLQMRQRTG
jgi:glycosyltransferase involved in cell wall biosynthesis